MRLAFTWIDPDISAARSWMAREDPLGAQDVDHALRIAEKQRANVDPMILH